MHLHLILLLLQQLLSMLLPQVAAQASFSGFGASGGGGFSVGVSSKEEAFNRVQNTNKEQYEYYIGGNPPSGDFSSGSTESLREWARSADEKPVPIQYKMTSIDNLLKPGYFKDITYGMNRDDCVLLMTIQKSM